MTLWEAALLLLFAGVIGTVCFTLVSWWGALSDREPQTTALGALAALFASRNPGAPSVIAEQPKFSAPRLMEEVENNLRITAEVGRGQLVPFGTRIWDAGQYEFYDIPTFLRNDLKRVYDMIRLANQIVWFSIEFDRKTQDLDEAYKEISRSIAERLRRIKQNLE